MLRDRMNPEKISGPSDWRRWVPKLTFQRDLRSQVSLTDCAVLVPGPVLQTGLRPGKTAQDQTQHWKSQANHLEAKLVTEAV